MSHFRRIPGLAVIGLLACTANLFTPPAGKAAIAANDGVMEPFSLSVYNTGVGVGTDSKGYVETFARNGIMYQNSQALGSSQANGYFTIGGWSALVARFITPYMASDPVVATNANNMLDVFFIGPDGNPWHQYQLGYDDNNNSTWSLIPSPLVPAQLPSVGATPFSNMAVASVGGILHVYYIGANGAIWEISQSATGEETGWNAPVSLGTGGIATGHPTAIVSGQTIYVFYRSDEADPVTGNRGAIYYLTQDGAPVKIIGTPAPVITSDVAPVVNSDGRVELFYRGSEDGLWHVWQTSPGGAWSTPKQLSETGGTVTSDPVATLNAGGAMQVFYRGSDGDIWTVVRSKDNQDAGEWSCRADLMNSVENKADVAASPISIAMNKQFDTGALQLFYAGGRNLAVGGSVLRSAVDNGQKPNPASPDPAIVYSINDVWTVVQTSAGNNPDCPGNTNTGWTLPTSIGGLMLQTMPPFHPANPD